MATQSHDRFFKEFFRRFLPTILHLFFPEEASKLDFSTLRFSDKELIINFPKRKVRIGDILAEIQTYNGEPQTLILHVEVEAREKKSLPQRLFEYYGMIRFTEEKMVLPVAFVLLPGTKGVSWEIYEEVLFGREMVRFQYAQIGICDLLANDYLHHENPLAVVLTVFMKVPGWGKAKWRNLVDVKLTVMRRLMADQTLTEGDKLFLIELVKRYLPAEKFPAWLGDETMQALQETETFWYERVQKIGEQIGQQRGQQIGQQIGEQIGQQRGKQEMLLRLWRRKFGVVPAGVIQQLQAINDPALLDEIGDQLIMAQSLEQISLPTVG